MRAGKGIPLLRTGLLALNRDANRPTLDELNSVILPPNNEREVVGRPRAQTLALTAKSLADKRKSRLGTSNYLTKHVEISADERQSIMREGSLNFILVREGKVLLASL